jgi:hypothetical protein
LERIAGVHPRRIPHRPDVTLESARNRPDQI